MTGTKSTVAYALAADDALWGVAGAGFAQRMLARNAETDGSITVMDYTCPPGFAGPPLHAHDDTDELMFIVDGELLVEFDATRRNLGPGDFLYVPRGTVHGFAHTSSAPCR